MTDERPSPTPKPKSGRTKMIEAYIGPSGSAEHRALMAANVAALEASFNVDELAFKALMDGVTPADYASLLVTLEMQTRMLLGILYGPTGHTREVYAQWLANVRNETNTLLAKPDGSV